MPHVSLLSLDLPKIHALVDSGSTHCFVDIKFVHKNKFTTYSVALIVLWLFDGSSNFVITEAIDLSVQFPTTGDVTPMTFYLTLLDSECIIVLRHNWLTRYNPLIDWVLSSLTFRTLAGSLPVPLLTPSPVPPSNPVSGLSGQSDSGSAPSVDTPVCNPPCISLINAATFVQACKLEGSMKYQLQLCPSDSAKARSSSASTPPDLDIVPLEYHDYADVFSKAKASELPPHHDYNLKINLEEGTSPPLGTLYSLSLVKLSALWTFIDENLNTGFICPTTSSHAAPVLFVKKKDSSLRLCIDFQGLNKITKKDCYPLPLISDLLDSPSHAKIYSKIDLQHAYHLVQIAPGDEWKTAFCTHYGSYEWLVMPFGLTNAPAAFQRFVNTIFADMLDICVVMYLDDILIYSKDMEPHQQHIQEVLHCLRLHGLFTKPEKCEFHLDSVEYLGYCLSLEGLTMSPDKIQTISDWPEPRKVKDIQSFLGFANSYRQFIFSYSDIVVPLTWLTRKDAPWNFPKDCQCSFNALKHAFTTAPILTHFILDTPIIVETDASDCAVAGILSITCADGEICPVAYYSRTLTAPELNYDTHNKELLAIFKAFWNWHHYLEGSTSPIDVIMDHKNLKFLSQFNLVIHFCPGKLSAKPDALTRRWDIYPKEGDSGYARVNPQNLRPVFTQEQLTNSLRATYLEFPVLRAVAIMDVDSLHSDILSALLL